VFEIKKFSFIVAVVVRGVIAEKFFMTFIFDIPSYVIAILKKETQLIYGILK